MNKVSQTESLAMLGRDKVKEINGIARLLTGNTIRDWNARMAPSLIVRSEVEIFGLSMPRFALRCYLDESGNSFVNARRLGTLKAQLLEFRERRLEFGEPGCIPFLEEKPRNDWPEPSQQFANCSCIADSFLLPPTWLAGFAFITTELRTEYGEHINKNEASIAGTPYMMHIPLAGGGLCAQACCFMATALKHKYSNGVYGLSEVTVLAQNDDWRNDPPREIEVSGLTPNQVQNYFNAAGLGGEWQREWKIARTGGGGDCFHDVLRAYVTSDMPVFLPIDLARASGQTRKGSLSIAYSLMQRNKAGSGILPRENDPNYDFSLHRAFDVLQDNRHAVLIVGYNYGSKLFCYHDPAVRPFLVGSAEDFRRAATYSPEPPVKSEDKGTTPDSTDERSAVKKLLDGMFLPVTPQQVRLPLARWQDAADLNFVVLGSTGRGLIEIADLLANDYFRFKREGCQFPVSKPDERFKHLKLVQVNALVSKGGEVLSRGLYPLKDDRAAKLPQTLEEIQKQLSGILSRGDEHWIWVQFMTAGIVIWDAELPVPKDTDRVQYSPWGTHIKAVSNWEAPGEWKATYYFLKKPLHLACITSSSVSSLPAALEACNVADISHIELYTFMHDDAAELFRGTEGEAEKAPLGKMSKCSNHPRDIITVAKALKAKVGSDFKIIGFASFIAEIMSKSEPGTHASKAIIFLIQLARQMQRYGHPVEVIEIVAGSLLDGVWPAKDLGVDPMASTFGANLLSPLSGIGRLLTRLKPIALESLRTMERDERKPICQRLPVRIALELEPGPLYVLGDLEKLELLCDALDQDPILSPVVGLNLDIPHWALLAHITVDQVRARPSIFRRLFHAHLSDHGCGHFGDNPVSSINELKVFAPWIHLLNERHALSPDIAEIPFSGYVSLELEACKHKEIVSRSAEQARLLGLK